MEGISKLARWTDNLVTSADRCLCAFCPVIRRSPDFSGGTTRMGSDLAVECWRFVDDDGGPILSRGSITLIFDCRDSVIWNLHLKSHAGGVDEPGEDALGLTGVSDEVQASGIDSTPGTNE